MGGVRVVVVSVIAMLAWPASEAAAISRRKECRLSCGAAIDRCVAEGGKRRRCKRQTLKACRRDGLDACAVTTTSTSSPTSTTSLLGATTTTVIVVSTTTVAGASTSTALGSTTTTAGDTTSTVADTTTSVPTTSSTSTTFPEVHGCTGDNAVDRSGPSDDRTVTFVAYAYTPKCIRIAAGQTVTFSGVFASHPLVGGEVVGFDATPDPSSPITPTSSGTSKDVLFESGGVYPFYCDFHGVTQSMVGAVLVNP